MEIPTGLFQYVAKAIELVLGVAAFANFAFVNGHGAVALRVTRALAAVSVAPAALVLVAREIARTNQ